MDGASGGWIDPHVGSAAWTALRAHLDGGTRRVLLWGPPGVGRTTLLRRAAQISGAALVDAESLDDAARALRDAPRDRATVVAAVARAGLEADAYVECEPLPIDDGTDASALAFLLRLRARDGRDAAPGALEALRRIASHTRGLPGAVRRASELLRVLSAEALADRCDEAARQLVVHGRLVDDPLRLPPDAAVARTLDDGQRRAAIALFAGGEPMETSAAEARIAEVCDGSALDVLLALRDRGALRVEGDGRVHVPVSVARALATSAGWEAEITSATERVDRGAVEAGRAARARWLERGEPAALEAILRIEGPLLRAAERALPRAGDDPAASERLVGAILALRTAGEVREGARAHEALIARALDAIGDRPEAAALELERARSLRLTNEFAALEGALDAIDPASLPRELEARWCSERAHVFRRRRELELAYAHTERARELAASLGWAHEEAREVSNLGSIRYWEERIDDALRLFERGRALAARLGARRTEAIALSNACLCHGVLGDERSATAAGDAAVAIFRSLGDSGAMGTTTGHLGILAFQYGRLDDAERCFLEAEAQVEEAGYLDQLTFVRFNRAEATLARGRLDEAAALARSVEAMAAARPDPLVSSSLDALDADILEQQERLAEALAAIERGLARASSTASEEVRAQLGYRLARVLARLGDLERSRAAASEVEETLRAVRRPELLVAARIALDHAADLRAEERTSAPASLVAALRPSWEGLEARARIGVSAADSWAVRRAAQAYWRDLPERVRVAVEWAARDPDRSALCIDEAGERARAPGGAELEAAARRNAYRLARLLAIASPEARTSDALIRDMWPGERIASSAALNRLHNAVAQLRSAGLGDRLVRGDDGYRLAAELRVVVAGRRDPFAPR